MLLLPGEVPPCTPPILRKCGSTEQRPRDHHVIEEAASPVRSLYSFPSIHSPSESQPYPVPSIVLIPPCKSKARAFGNLQPPRLRPECLKQFQPMLRGDMTTLNSTI